MAQSVYDMAQHFVAERLTQDFFSIHLRIHYEIRIINSKKQQP